jgi:hypothetical protein
MERRDDDPWQIKLIDGFFDLLFVLTILGGIVLWSSLFAIWILS